MRFALITIALAAFGARAQSINVSFGGGAPSSTYAAAGGAGTWNAVSGVAGGQYPLVDVDGNATGIVVSQSPTTNTITDGDASLSGDDGALLNHGLLSTGDETCLSFQGFAPDTYEVLVYAWTPNATSVKSRTRQDEAASTIDVGGQWMGSHAAGLTFARYVVTVDETGSLPAHSGLAPNQPSAALNGVQIRPLSSITDPPPPSSDSIERNVPPLAPFTRVSPANPGANGTPRAPSADDVGGCSAAGASTTASFASLALVLLSVLAPPRGRFKLRSYARSSTEPHL